MSSIVYESAIAALKRILRVRLKTHINQCQKYVIYYMNLWNISRNVFGNELQVYKGFLGVVYVDVVYINIKYYNCNN